MKYASNTDLKTVNLSDVLAMTVRLQPSLDARVDAAEKGKAPNQPTGSIDNFVINSVTGQACWAVVSIGGFLGLGDRKVAIPSMALAPINDQGTLEFLLRATEEELKSLPEFDYKSARVATIHGVIQKAERAWDAARPSWRLPVDASSHPQEVIDTAVNSNAVLARDLRGCVVMTSNQEDFGVVDQICYNPEAHMMDYVVVGHGGVIGIGKTEYLVPFAACRIVHIGDDRKPTLMLNKSQLLMTNAPKYQQPEDGLLCAQDCRAVCDFYGVPRK